MRYFGWSLVLSYVLTVALAEYATTNECGKSCSDGSTSCCVRDGCGCVETGATFVGCVQSCKSEHSGLCCPSKCTADSKACCVVTKECGCSDLEEYMKYGGDATDCERTCAEGASCAILKTSDLFADDVDGVTVTHHHHSGSLESIFWYMLIFALLALVIVFYSKYEQFAQKWHSLFPTMSSEFQSIK
mmetsp:Transcript_6497/g.10289  ORF Transcript_6497/g.10289 Transcript_6497/m.10289 type:complete len:188 (-) Transcript_6497:91-654(-)